eukprot:m.68758 g.68758  ORF g.68758 m.68758 type:complete len:333 (-) comp23989_c0_seq1:124-1122(-)
MAKPLKLVQEIGKVRIVGHLAGLLKEGTVWKVKEIRYHSVKKGLTTKTVILVGNKQLPVSRENKVWAWEGPPPNKWVAGVGIPYNHDDCISTEGRPFGFCPKLWKEQKINALKREPNLGEFPVAYLDRKKGDLKAKCRALWEQEIKENPELLEKTKWPRKALTTFVSLKDLIKKDEAIEAKRKRDRARLVHHAHDQRVVNPHVKARLRQTASRSGNIIHQKVAKPRKQHPQHKQPSYADSATIKWQVRKGNDSKNPQPHMNRDTVGTSEKDLLANSFRRKDYFPDKTTQPVANNEGGRRPVNEFRRRPLQRRNMHTTWHLQQLREWRKKSAG